MDKLELHEKLAILAQLMDDMGIEFMTDDKGAIEETGLVIQDSMKDGEEDEVIIWDNDISCDGFIISAKIVRRYAEALRLMAVDNVGETCGKSAQDKESLTSE